MLLRVTLTREGEFISDEFIDNGKNQTEYWNQVYASWAREIASDLVGD